MRSRSQFDRNTIFGDAPVSWLDDLDANGVAFLVTRDRIWPSVWHHMFWNRSITRVVRLRNTRSPGVVPQDVATIRDDGVLVNADGAPIDAAQLVTPTSTLSVGDVVTTISPNTEAGFTLWSVEPPLRIRQRVIGLQPNGDLYGGGEAVIEVYGCGPGELQLTLLGKQGAPTRIRLNGRVVAERAIPPGDVWRPAVREPEGADGSVPCVYVLESDGLIGSTRIEFVRSG
jgi:hypothetical protein